MNLCSCFSSLFDKESSPDRSMFNFNLYSTQRSIDLFFFLWNCSDQTDVSFLFLQSKKNCLKNKNLSGFIQGCVRVYVQKMKAPHMWQGDWLPEDVLLQRAKQSRSVWDPEKCWGCSGAIHTIDTPTFLRLIARFIWFLSIFFIFALNTNTENTDICVKSHPGFYHSMGTLFNLYNCPFCTQTCSTWAKSFRLDQWEVAQQMRLSDLFSWVPVHEYCILPFDTKGYHQIPLGIEKRHLLSN